jgi:hypothetical protein
MTIQVSIQGMSELASALKGVEKKIKINLAAGINATAKKVTTFAARELKKTLPVPVGILKKALRAKGKANQKKLYAIVAINKGYPIPLKYFGAKQTKSGVTYRIQKGGRRSINRKWFVVPQYGNGVFVRLGQKRYPIETVYGPSPSEAFKAAGLESKVRQFAESELPKQIDRRIRLALLRASGVVKQRKYG